MNQLRNSRHEAFARLIAEGRSQSDAYRAIFPRSRVWAADSVHERASKLNAKVLPRVRELQSAIADKVCIEKAEAVAILAEALRATPADVKDTSRFAQEMTIDPVSGRITIRLPSKTAVFSELAKALGWYAPVKSEVAVALPPHEDISALLKDRLANIRAKK